MAEICGDSVLTGQDGSIEFKPPGTSFCLNDFSDFGTDGTTSHITVPCTHDYRVGDIVCFYEDPGASIDTAFQASTDPDRPVTRVVQDGTILSFGSAVAGSGYTDGTYTGVALTGGSGSGATADIVVASGGMAPGSVLVDGGTGYKATDQLSVDDASVGGGGGSGFTIEVDSVFSAGAGVRGYYVVATGSDWIEVSGTATGAAITVNGDGGTGTVNAGIIEIELCDFYAVCGVREFSLDISREELDVTTLPCFDDADDGCSKLANFRQTQSGFASATGTMTVYFTGDQENISNRLLGSAVLKDQTGARTKLYVSTKSDGTGVDDSASLFVDAYINISGMSFSVNPDDPTSAELSFSVKKMVSAFGLKA
jgi:hypothetical protein